MLTKVSLGEVRFACEYARKKLTFNEPIPDFDTRFPNILESCLAAPFQRVFGHTPYPRLIDQASVLFYHISKDHPFQNGNKRIAIVVLLVFLRKRKKWLRVDWHELFDFSLWVAASEAKARPFILMATQEFIREHLVKADAR